MNKEYKYTDVDASPNGSVFTGGGSSYFVKWNDIVWWVYGRETGSKTGYPADKNWRADSRPFFKTSLEIRDAKLMVDKEGQGVKLSFSLNNPREIMVRLNDEYSAKVSPDGITVGCQTFPLSVVKELSLAVQQITEK